ncbi:MAG: methyl-accepting chemotaxis protein [Oceanospirillaceae bacterium]
MTIKQKIISSISLSIFLIITLLAFISNHNISQSSMDSTIKFMDEEVSATGKTLEQKMEVLFIGLELAASLYSPDRAVAASLDKEALAREMAPITALTKSLNIINAYAGHKGGVTYSSSTAGEVPNFNAKEKKREWYLRIFAGDKRLITKPYKSAEGGLVMAIAVPVLKNGVVVSTMNANLALTEISSFIEQLNPAAKIDLTRDDGFIIAGANEWIGKNQFERYPTMIKYQNQQSGSDIIEIDSKRYQMSFYTIQSLGWTVWRYVELDEIYQSANASLQSIILSGVILFIISLIVISYLITRLLKPLANLTATLKNLTSGNGDLTQRLDVIGNDEITIISQEVNNFIATIHSLIQEILDASSAISTSAVTLKDRNTANSEVLDKHGLETEQVVAAIEELSTASSDVSGNALAASKLTSQTDTNVKQSKTSIDQANQTTAILIKDVGNVSDQISNMNDAIGKITKVLSVIGDIAEQTNLLALNASIEAARAGDQGRGFAVVADEVRTLAARTQTSTSEIETTLAELKVSSNTAIEAVQTSQQSCEKTSQSASDVNKELDLIVVAVAEMNSLNSQIATASQQQSTVTGDIAQTMVYIQGIVENLSKSSLLIVEETERLEHSNVRLKTVVSKFKL